MAMANEYPAAEVAPDEPEIPQDAPDEPDNGSTPAKISQAEANYRASDKTRCCGLCANFTGSAGEGAFQCTKVEGEISPFGFSDLYERQDNPFRIGETGEFTGGTPVIPGAAPVLGGPNLPGGGTLAATAGQGPPQSANPMIAPNAVMPSPRLRIGNRSYGGM
jgi:hypothetical protein